MAYFNSSRPIIVVRVEARKQTVVSDQSREGNYESTCDTAVNKRDEEIPPYFACRHLCKGLVPSCPPNMGGRSSLGKVSSPNEAKACTEKSKADEGGGAGIIHQRGELTVQRLSAEVSGKVQKFSRIGAREFEPFADYEDITLNLLVRSTSHPQSVKSVVCDVLAGEQGPSCSTSPLEITFY
ncbi:hypothetical protein OS493_035794 [Desmophyllum pertusum]|uniref:Uncharacterized protein n=1 Tax=Desmophyllum pertusum TaxID=174260 RepID=A0A9W9YIB4_9CNID|nr:hypothetical protein OS493_035794 [Desmophyllum pertusum]